MGPVELLTRRLEPSTHGPHVEQVGWGVARQVARRLAERVGPRPLLDLLVERAEQPGWAAYVVLQDRDAVAVALLRLDGEPATYAGQVVAPDAPPATAQALLVRALHDAGAAGAARLLVPEPPVDLTAWPTAANAR